MSNDPKVQEDGSKETACFHCSGPNKDGEIQLTLPSLGFAFFSVASSANFSSGDLDLCRAGRVGSLNRMVSLPPIKEKRKLDVLVSRESWQHPIHPHPLTGCLHRSGTISIISNTVDKGWPVGHGNSVKQSHESEGQAATNDTINGQYLMLIEQSVLKGINTITTVSGTDTWEAHYCVCILGSVARKVGNLI